VHSPPTRLSTNDQRRASPKLAQIEVGGAPRVLLSNREAQLISGTGVFARFGFVPAAPDLNLRRPDVASACCTLPRDHDPPVGQGRALQDRPLCFGLCFAYRFRGRQHPLGGAGFPLKRSPAEHAESDYESEGRRFESCWARHQIAKITRISRGADGDPSGLLGFRPPHFHHFGGADMADGELGKAGTSTRTPVAGTCT